jgi:hypothetical protein
VADMAGGETGGEEHAELKSGSGPVPLADARGRRGSEGPGVVGKGIIKQATAFKTYNPHGWRLTLSPPTRPPLTLPACSRKQMPTWGALPIGF